MVKFSVKEGFVPDEVRDLTIQYLYREGGPVDCSPSPGSFESERGSYYEQQA